MQTCKNMCAWPFERFLSEAFAAGPITLLEGSCLQCLMMAPPASVPGTISTSAIWEVVKSLKSSFGILQASTVSAVEQKRSSWGRGYRERLHDSMRAGPCTQEFVFFLTTRG